MSVPLTALIPCKNEQRNIEACIASVRGLADEILVADSGSTDATLDLVRAQQDCRIIEREFIDSGDFKNWAIPQARCPWVMVLDADERVTPELASEIRAVLREEPPHDGYWIRRANHFMGHRIRHTSWGSDRVIRLFHRDRGRYDVYTDHAEVLLPPTRVGQLRGRIIHYTCWDYDNYLPKMLRYTRQQAELWHAQGRRPSVWRMATTGPARFLRSYLLDLGFLDGTAGFQISMLTGFYSFLKQARLWQLSHGKALQQLEPSSAVKPASLASAHLGDRPVANGNELRQPAA